MGDWNNGMSSTGNPTWENNRAGCFVEEKEDGFHVGLLGNPTIGGPFDDLNDAKEAALDLVGEARE